MWNNLKSDVYRTLHTKSFYIMLFLMVGFYMLTLGSNGFSTSTNYAHFSRDINTFGEYLYFLPKSYLFVMMSLLYLGIFAVDEYMAGFTKNTYPLQVNKWKQVMERYLFSIVIIALFYAVLLGSSLLLQLVYPLELGSFDVGTYPVFVILQIMSIAAAACFTMLLSHLFRSKVAVVLFAIVFGFILNALMMMLCYLLLDSLELLQLTMYVKSGTLPYVFAGKEYGELALVVLGNTLLYNGISYYILKKKDL